MQRLKGMVGYYRLSDWFLATFSPEERAGMQKLYRAGYDDPRVTLTTGDIGEAPPAETVLRFIGSLAQAFEDFPAITQRILRKGIETIAPATDIIDIHFFYGVVAKTAYRHRDKVNGALETAMDFCNKQIQIAPMVMDAFRR